MQAAFPANRGSWRWLVWVAVLLAGLAWLMIAVAQDRGREALVLTVQDAITPATADYVIRGIESAEERSAELVVLQLDTPGGLDSSMRSIIQAILQARVPVASYVHPAGGRAASAGTYILYGSPVAAMTPSTNLGSATPVQIGGGGLPGMPSPDEGGNGKGESEPAEAGHVPAWGSGIEVTKRQRSLSGSYSWTAVPVQVPPSPPNRHRTALMAFRSEFSLVSNMLISFFSAW